MEYDTKIGFCLFNRHMSSDRSDSFICHGISFYRGNRLSSVTHITIMIIVFWNVKQCRLREGTNVRIDFLPPSSLLIPENEGSMFIQSADKCISDCAAYHCRKNVKSHIFIAAFKISDKIL